MDIIIPVFKTPNLIFEVVKSYLHHDKTNFIKSIQIIENSKEYQYFNSISKLDSRINCQYNLTKKRSSEANAEAIEIGVKNCTSKYVFLAHSDSAVLSHSFYEILKHYIKNEYYLVGTMYDKIRIGAFPSTGILAKKTLLDKVNIYPKYNRFFPKIWKKIQTLDVCDNLTGYSRLNALKIDCLRNTYNGHKISKKFLELSLLSRLDTCLNQENEPIFTHIGRGTIKSHGRYKQLGKPTIEDFLKLIKKFNSL